MRRGELTDEQWEKLYPLLPPQKPIVGRPAQDHRLILNGILWIVRTVAPWRDLPERYGPWGTVASRFYRWVNAGKKPATTSSEEELARRFLAAAMRRGPDPLTEPFTKNAITSNAPLTASSSSGVSQRATKSARSIS